MHATRPTRRHRNGWTPERRARQAEAIRSWQPWTRSTGPRSKEGKARMRYNGYKHGMCSQAMRHVRLALKKHRAFLALYDKKWKKHFREKQRQYKALLGRYRKKMQLHPKVRMENEKIFKK